MKLTNGRVGAVALTALLALSLAACGSDDPTGDTSKSAADSSSDSASAEPALDLSGELNGSGASSQESAMDAWRASFQATYPDVTINYDPVGSGGGRTAFISGGVSFAGTDSAFADDELTQAVARCENTGIVEVPVYISPIAVVFNLDGVDTLNLSPATVAGIFAGTITSWDAPEIAADNPDAKLPSLAITPVHRSDDSGTTKNFTDYLSKTAAAAWTYPAAGVWPFEGGESAQGTSGVIQTIEAGQGTIGYADFSKAGGLGIASIKVGDEFVAPSAEAAAAVADVSPRDDSRTAGDIVIKIDRTTTEAGAYPLILISYLTACETYASADEAALVKAFLTHVASAEGQEESGSSAGSAPISDALRTEVQAAIDLIAAK